MIDMLFTTARFKWYTNIKLLLVWLVYKVYKFIIIISLQATIFFDRFYMSEIYV